MSAHTVAEIVAIIETWQQQKTMHDGFTQRDLRNFVEINNAMSRRLIRAFDRQNPEFYESLIELCVNAQTLTTKGAKIVADGIDRTNV